MENEDIKLKREAAEVTSAAHVLYSLADQLDVFLSEARDGELTIMQDGKNVLSERADSAQTALVAASRIRTHLTHIENTADRIISAAEARHEDNLNDFFGRESDGT